MEQGYLALDDQSEIRLRRAGENLFLTVKQGQGESRSETEVNLDREAFDDLWPESAGRRVEKTRSRIDLEGGLVAELDQYEGDLEGLLTVEVEFQSPEAAVKFKPPAWFGRELTGDSAWANRSLATKGIPKSRFIYRLRPEEELVEGVARIIVSRAAQAAAEVRAAIASDQSAKHVHDARKALKKARSAIRLLRGVISDEERERAQDACRESAKRLSGARDAEVKLGTLQSVFGSNGSRTGVEEWRSELQVEAARLQSELTAERLAEALDAIEGVRRQFLGRELKAEDELVAGNIGRGYRAGRKDGRKARSSEEPEVFHDWRKRSKDLRYQLEIASPRLPKSIRSIRKRAVQLSETLGDLHDLDVLKEDLASRGFDQKVEKQLAKLIEDARDLLVESCLSQGADTYEMKPGRFTNLVAESLSASA